MNTDMNAHTDTLAAWADGESVDRSAVLRALADADAREYVVDLMSLRHAVTRTLPHLPSDARPSTMTPRRVPAWTVVAVAASLLVCAGAGFLAGRRTQPAQTMTSAISPAATDDARPSAPRPTRVIRLESGVDWRENVGGN
jgi:hypothetical protein